MAVETAGIIEMGHVGRRPINTELMSGHGPLGCHGKVGGGPFFLPDLKGGLFSLELLYGSLGGIKQTLGIMDGDFSRTTDGDGL